MDPSGGLAGALDGTVDSGTGCVEKFGNFNGRVRSRVVHGNQMCFLWLGGLGCFPRSFPFALATAIPHGFVPNQVCRKFGNHGKNIEKELTHGIAWVVDGVTYAELDLATSEFINDVFCIAR